MDLINFKTTVTNEATNARENFNLNNDYINIYIGKQSKYNFSKSLELDKDMKFLQSDNEKTKLQINFPQETETNNEPKIYEAKYEVINLLI